MPSLPSWYAPCDNGRRAFRPDRRRRAVRGRAGARHPRGRSRPRVRGRRRPDGARRRRGARDRSRAPRRSSSRSQRARGVPRAPRQPAFRQRADRHAHGGRAAGRRHARTGGRRRRLSHQAVLAGAAPVAGRSPAAARRMASRVERDPASDYRRLHAAYQQSLRYAEDVRRLYHQLQRAICQSLLGLANALEAKDPYTRGHSERVAALSRRVASALGLGSGVVDTGGQAGLLHDIGKIGVPEAILKKPGPLSPEEWEIMRAHPVIGAQIVAPFEFFGDAARVIRHHHERWDGSGYPDGLVRETIPLEARIVAVADVFDALTSARSYRPARWHISPRPSGFGWSVPGSRGSGSRARRPVWSWRARRWARCSARICS